jgi:hypothetical protein
MKRRIFILFVGILALGICGGFLTYNRRAQAVIVQVNTKGIPEHGLVMIAPSDPTFESHLSDLTRHKPNPVIEAIKPFSVFVTNISKKTVVAYQIKWIVVKSDGKIYTRETGGYNLQALMDGDRSGVEEMSRTGVYAIEPDSTRYVSLLSSLSKDNDASIGGYAGGGDSSTITRLQQSMQGENLAPILENILGDLQHCTSITVSIDGVFFEDGTFVGPDSTQFFEQTSAIVDAKRDLLEEIDFGVKHGRSLKDVFRDVEELSNKPHSIKAPGATPTEYYNDFKTFFAQEAMNVKQTLGKEKAIGLLLRPLQKQWPRLRKL